MVTKLLLINLLLNFNNTSLCCFYRQMPSTCNENEHIQVASQIEKVNLINHLFISLAFFGSKDGTDGCGFAIRIKKFVPQSKCT